MPRTTTNALFGNAFAAYAQARGGAVLDGGTGRPSAISASNRKGRNVADLIVIGYDDEETASKAAAEVARLASDLVIEPEQIAVIRRDKEGKFHVETTHHPVAEGVTWGMFWGVLFGLIFFVPVFGLALGGLVGALSGLIAKIGIDKGFQEEVRDMVQPGTSALFLVVDKITPDKAIEALSKYGGRVLKTSLSSDAEREIQEALHGAGTAGGDGAAAPAGPTPAGATT
jgi:uncharacterized membrane protein